MLPKLSLDDFSIVRVFIEWSVYVLCVCPPGCRFSNHASFQDILNEMNDYAGQRELIAENMMTSICVELTKYLQDLKQERKAVRNGGRAEFGSFAE